MKEKNSLITRLQEKIEKAQSDIEGWKARIKSIQNNKVDIDELNELYWNHGKEWRIPSLCEKFHINAFELRTFLRPCRTGFLCPRCGKEHIATSRADAKERFKCDLWKIKEDPKRWCGPCATKYQLWKQGERQKDREEEISRLKSISYQEYLQSDHWKKKRAYHLRRSDYRCQVCNRNNVTLNVHHRDYSNRGDESFEDLITLCQDCHGLFHQNGRVQ